MTAATAVALTEAMQELALVSIQPKGGSVYQFAGIIEEVSPSIGDRDIEGIPLINGGRVVKKTPQADHELTLKIYPTDTRFSSSKDLIQGFMNVDASWDGTAPFADTNTHNQELFQVCVVWCNDSTIITTANGTSTAGTQARRIVIKDMRMTSYKDSFDDKMVSAEITFKAPAFDTSGTGTVKYESCEASGSAGLPVIADYT